MSVYFLDTGYLIALEASGDKNHVEAVQHWNACLNAPLKIVTTTYVFDEVVTFLTAETAMEKLWKWGNVC